VLDTTLQALIDTARQAPDATGYFPAMYARMTRRVLDDATAGRFHDAERMQRFVAAFAARYLTARADPVSAPRCWRAHFDTAGDAGLLVVQHLLLGINAHVNHDLAPTVVDLVDAGASLESIRPDFDAINDILADVYRDLTRDLDRVTRWTARADAYGGGRLFRFSLSRAREQAWQAAVRLAPLDPAARRAELRAIDDLVAVLARLIAHPAAPVRWLAWLLRRLETSHPPTVTTALLGPLAPR
jgi:hypothetical protein